MANVLPTTTFPGYLDLASGGVAPEAGVFIPLAALPGLSTSEAAAASGDGSKVVYELIRAAQTNIAALPAADRPTRMTLSRGIPSGVDQNTLSQTFGATFQLVAGNLDVAAEP